MVRTVRTVPEKLIDRLLTLYLITDALKYIKFLGETRVQKLVFLSERSMLKEYEKGFNYSYIKLDWGPFSPDLRADLGSLIEQEFLGIRTLETDNGAIQGYLIANEVKTLFDDFKEILQRNDHFLEAIRRVNREYARDSLKRLLRRVYAMPHPYLKRRTIASLAPRNPILYPIESKKASRVFEITPEELDDLEMYLDKELSMRLEEAMKDAKTRHLLSHREVFGTL